MENGSSQFASTMKTTKPLDFDSYETMPLPKVPPHYTSLCLSDFPKIRRRNRQDAAKRFRREYLYGGTMDRKTCVWSCDGDSWLDKSSGIMWLGVHGINAICVVTRTGDLDIKRVRGSLKKHTVESFLQHFRQTIITEIEDLEYPPSEFPDQPNKLCQRVDHQPNKLRQRVDHCIKKPFGVVSVVTPEVDKESSHEASYDEDRENKYNKLADFLLEKCEYMLTRAQESIQKEYNLPAPAPLDEKDTIKFLLEKMETDATFMINGTVKAVEHDEKKAIKFFQEKMESDVAFTKDETIQAAICGFQQLLGKELKANEIGVTVLDYFVSGPEARYNNGYAKQLEIHDIEMHLAAVNKPCNGGFSSGRENEAAQQLQTAAGIYDWN